VIASAAAVPRLRDALSLGGGEPFVVLYGPGASDTFVDTRYQERELEDALAQTLRDAGYQHVVFSSAKQPWYCLDEESTEYFTRLVRNSDRRGARAASRSRTDISGQIQRPQGGVAPETGANPVPAEGMPQSPSYAMSIATEQRREHSFDKEALRLLNACLRIKDTRTAIVIPRAGDYLRFSSAERDLADWFAKWQQAPTVVDNICVLVFTDKSLTGTAEFLKSLGYANVLVSCVERQRGRPSGQGSGEVTGPDPAEIERIVQLARIRDRRLLPTWRDWLDYDKILAAMSSRPEVPANIWGRRLHQLASAGLVLSQQELRRQRWVDSLPSDQSAWDRLTELTGLAEVKEHVNRLRWRAEAEAKRRRQGLLRESGSLHLVFTGGPGTGKTTVARLIGELYREMGLLRRGHLHAPEASDLIGMYVGHTAVQTNREIDKALDGVLFIDEAYRLSEAPGGFGQEAIDSLITRMDNDRDRLVVVVAGYPDKMTAFLRSNPGLPRRFPRGNIIEFPDYSPADLYSIALGMLRDRQLSWVPELEAELRAVVEGLHRDRDGSFGNAGEMRNLVQELEDNWALRVRADIAEPVTQDDLPASYRRSR
jgi:hypothetical protein